MNRKYTRTWQSISSVLLACGTALMSTGLIIGRSDEAFGPFTLLVCGSCLLIVGIFAAARSLGPDERRLSLYQSIFYFSTGKKIRYSAAKQILEGKKIIGSLEFSSLEKGDSVVLNEQFEPALLTLLSHASKGDIAIEGVQRINENASSEYKEIPTGILSTELFSIRSPNSLALGDYHPDIERHLFFYEKVCLRFDELKMLRRKYLIQKFLYRLANPLRTSTEYLQRKEVEWREAESRLLEEYGVEIGQTKNTDERPGDVRGVQKEPPEASGRTES